MQREATIHENSPAAAFSMNLKQHLPMLLEGLFAQIKSVSGLFLTRRLPEDYSFDSDSGIDADADHVPQQSQARGGLADPPVPCSVPGTSSTCCSAP